MLERVAIPLSRGSFWTRDWTQVSRIAGRFFTIWATREVLIYIDMRAGPLRRLNTKCFWTVMLEYTLRVPWTARRSNQSILKEIKPEYSLEGLMLKLKLQFLTTWSKEPIHWIRPWCWKDWRQEEKRVTEDEMVGWHHWLNGHEFE